MKKKLKVTLIIISVLIILLIGVFIALTLPKDLGVRYTKEDLVSVNKKLGINYGPLSASNDPKNSLKLIGKKALDASITASEMTALLNQPSTQWKNYPISNVQFRINSDGTVEMTGKILASRFNSYSKATNMPKQYYSLLKDEANLVPLNPSFYYKGDYQVQNGQLVGSTTELKMGPLQVPDDWTNNNKDFINGFVEDRLNSAGLNIQSATFTDGKLNIKGTVPETINFEN